MNLKNRVLTIVLCTFAGLAFSQSTTDKTNTTDSVNSDKDSNTYLIHVDESADDHKFFPKLYPIGYIVKEKSTTPSKTTYYLGEFKSDNDAKEALQTVKSLGYPQAFIVQNGR